jgi:hypothetical protein
LDVNNLAVVSNDADGSTNVGFVTTLLANLPAYRTPVIVGSNCAASDGTPFTVAFDGNKK